MNIIQEISQEVIGERFNIVEEVIMSGGNISEVTGEVAEVLDEMGRKWIKAILEMIDMQVRESDERKREWNIQRRRDIKTYQTIFGELRYERTYYKHKYKEEFAYLSDLVFGIGPNHKVEPSIKIKAIENSIEMSYEKSGEKAAENVKLSRQTVMNEIRSLEEVKHEFKGIKKEVENIYIEADEDHVALQQGSNCQIKLIYVHEGVEAVSKSRNRLKNVRYFTGDYKNSEERWLEVADYLEERYDLGKVKNIYISGDGAGWIKAGLDWVVGSKYVLDRYHLTKSINTSTAHLKTEKDAITAALWIALDTLDRKRVNEIYNTIIEITEKETKKEAVEIQKKYVSRNWQGIVNGAEEAYSGCSAEGHVSHLLSARLSSRPMGWSKLGAIQMSNLRSFNANGGKIVDIFYAKKEMKKLEEKRIAIDKEIIIKRLRKTSNETRGNITVLNVGKKTWLQGYLKSVRGL